MTPPKNVSAATYYRESRKRLDYCVQADAGWDAPKHAGVAMVVLSCKRPKELSRLLHSMVDAGPAWTIGLTQSWFVDNGSGPEVEGIARKAELFTHYQIHRKNIGMGPAINDVMGRVNARYILFVEDDLILDWYDPFVKRLLSIFEEYPQIGIIKLKRKANWDSYPYRRIGPMQTTTTGVRFHPWLPSPRWTFRWGQRPWYRTGIHNVWSLGPVMFRWAAWAATGNIPPGQGRGQAIAAEEEYGKKFNQHWLAARPVDIQPFLQPVTQESPGYGDVM